MQETELDGGPGQMWRQEGVITSCRHDLRRELDQGAGDGAQGGDGLRICGRCRMGRTGWLGEGADGDRGLVQGYF